MKKRKPKDAVFAPLYPDDVGTFPASYSGGHVCPFCGVAKDTLDLLAGHVIAGHRKVVVDLGRGPEAPQTVFRVSNYAFHRKMQWTVFCFCGERFDVGRHAPAAPAMREWVLSCSPAERNSFTAHLRREGGLAEHLRRVREEVLACRIAGVEWKPRGSR